MDPNDKDNKNNRDDNYLGKLFESVLGGAMKASIVQEARENDKRIENAVVYKITQGYTVVPQQNISIMNILDSQDEMAKEMEKKQEYQRRITAMFKEFKQAIKNKSMTLEEIEAKVYSEHGVVKEEWNRDINPLDDGEFQFKVMSEDEYKTMRESYDGYEEKSEKTTK